MSTEFFRQTSAAPIEIARVTRPRRESFNAVVEGLKRRWQRERRRRKVGRAYDMALEIARAIPRGSDVLDVGCGNGFIAHHLSALLGRRVSGIDVMGVTQAPIDYHQYDGVHFPLAENSVDAVLLCYVLHHAHDPGAVLNEVKRVLRVGGLAVIYEDIPEAPWDRFICWTHNLQWRKRSGACTFRNESEWLTVFQEAGFEAMSERQLARTRNLMHPVRRRFYLLRTPFDEASVPPALLANQRSQLSVSRYR